MLGLLCWGLMGQWCVPQLADVLPGPALEPAHFADNHQGHEMVCK